MIKTTRWSPDTCGCVIEYQWNTEDAPQARTHSIKNIVKACPAHANLADKADHFEKVKEENRRKNKVLNEAVLKHIPRATKKVIGEDGVEQTVLDLSKVNFEFDENRVLKVFVEGLQVAEKTAAQAEADEKVGNGKSKIE
jgi:light-regulated signal transduction histidine kinase (bacteriophytochrome)